MAQSCGNTPTATAQENTAEIRSSERYSTYFASDLETHGMIHGMPHLGIFQIQTEVSSVTKKEGMTRV